jgi:hypothetical protein
MERGAVIVVLAALAVAGTLHTSRALFEEALTMQGQHWIMLLVAVALGYVAGRMFPQAGQAVGLP